MNIEEARQYCLSLKNVTEGLPFGDDFLVFKVEGKMFALLPLDGNEPRITLKCHPDFTDELRDHFSAVEPAWHFNNKYWNTIILDGTIPEKDIKKMIKESYDIITDSPTKRIYEAVKQIPKGHVATYGQVAAMAGNPKMSRAVGNALHKNPDPENIPCFRVVNAKGELAEAFAFGGEGKQAKLLEEDGVVIVDGKVDLDVYGM